MGGCGIRSSVVGNFGSCEVNWKTLIMNFCIYGQKVQIRGDHELTRTLVTPKVLKRGGD